MSDDVISFRGLR